MSMCEQKKVTRSKKRISGQYGPNSLLAVLHKECFQEITISTNRLIAKMVRPIMHIKHYLIGNNRAGVRRIEGEKAKNVCGEPKIVMPDC